MEDKQITEIKKKPLIEWMHDAFGLEFKSVHDFIKRKSIKVNDVVIKNPSYSIKEGDIVAVNNKPFVVTFTRKKLEADIQKFQSIYEKSKERNDFIFYIGEKNNCEIANAVEIIINEDGEAREHVVEKNIYTRQTIITLKDFLRRMGHDVECKSMPEELIPDIKTKFHQLEDKHPRLCKMLWLVIQPWRSATCVYDIILAVIANLIILAILLSPVLLLL